MLFEGKKSIVDIFRSVETMMEEFSLSLVSSQKFQRKLRNHTEWVPFALGRLNIHIDAAFKMVGESFVAMVVRDNCGNVMFLTVSKVVVVFPQIAELKPLICAYGIAWSKGTFKVDWWCNVKAVVQQICKQLDLCVWYSKNEVFF